MGTNRRYGERGMTERIDQITTRGVQPDTLTDQQVDRENQQVTIPPRAVPVHAWIRYGNVQLHVEAEAVGWTARAVAIRWKSPEGPVHRAWVWAGAVGDR